MKQLSFEHALVATLAYFDIFGFPLTAQELYKQMWRYATDEFSFVDFLRKLEQAVHDKTCKQKNGFYYLNSGEKILEKRKEATKYCEIKLRKARPAICAISAIPFVKALFVCNTVAGGWPSKSGDIDVLIVIKSGHLWFTRLIITLIVAASGLRRNKHKVENRVCLSFYITDKAFDLASIALDEPDIYLHYWLRSLLPLYDSEAIYDSLQDHNAWAHSYMSKAKSTFGIAPRLQIALLKPIVWLKKLAEHIYSPYEFESLEIYAALFQRMRMSFNKKSVQFADDTRVVINDNMMKFHENDRRAFFRDQWIATCVREGADKL